VSRRLFYRLAYLTDLQYHQDEHCVDDTVFCMFNTSSFINVVIAQEPGRIRRRFWKIVGLLNMMYGTINMILGVCLNAAGSVAVKSIVLWA